MSAAVEESSSSRPHTSTTPAAASRSPSHNAAGAFYLAKTVLRGSVVLQAVCGHFRSPSSYDVVFGKETSIELVIIDEDGIIQSISEQPVFGTIKDLAVLPSNKAVYDHSPKILGKDTLIVISDSGKLSFLFFCNEMHRFFPLANVQLSAPGNSRNQVGRMLAIDSSAFEDQLAIFAISTSPNSTDIIDKRIFCPPEKDGRLKTARGSTNISGTIWSMCFISKDYRQPSKEHKPLLAILLNRWGSFYRNELLLLEWNIDEHAVNVVYQFAEAGPLAYHIVEVPHSNGFAFLFRAGDIVLMDFRNSNAPSCVYRTSLNFTPVEEKKIKHIIRIPDIMDEEGIHSVAASALLELGDLNKSDDPMSIDDYGSVQPGSNYVCSWCWEPGAINSSRIIFSADSGELYAIEMIFEPDGSLRVNLSDCLHKSLPCNVLLWLEGGFVVAIADMADGTVFKFEEGVLKYRSSIQNIAPILDMCIVDYPDEKHDQIFACSGMASEGSLRIIRSGISVEKLLKTAPIYQGVTGTWTLKMNVSDLYHSFLVLSFVEETRVLSVGVSFADVTELVGFQPDVCTLACGVVGDGMIVQIHQFGVKLCLPVRALHPEGIASSSPVCTSWFPDNMNISLGAVGQGRIVVATSSPCYLFILGIISSSASQYEVYQIYCVKLQNELSCISIPVEHPQQNTVLMRFAADYNLTPDVGNLFVVGTHRPSVEVVSFTHDKGFQVLAVGIISLTNTMGTTISGCVPQDVKLVLVDRMYVLSGLRNGMLLRFEWSCNTTLSSTEPPCAQAVGSWMMNSPVLSNSIAPNTKIPAIFMSNTSGRTKGEFPVNLELIAVRRIGITPVFLVSLSDSLDADMIALSDRPWLLQTARQSLSYTSISFQPSTHVTPVCSIECPRGILFVAENSLHLVEMVPSKRLNVQKFHIGGTPRKILYHNESRLLLVMRTELDNDSCSSDVCCVDPLSGSVLSSFKFDPGETGKCMQLVKVGNEHVLVIGVSQSAGPAIMPSGEAESTKGRLVILCLDQMQNSDSCSVQRNSPIGGYGGEQLSSSSLCSSPDDNSCDGIKLEETEAWHLRLAYSTNWPGMPIAICPYLDRYFLASAGNSFYVCGFPNDNSQRVRRLAVGRTRFTIMTLSVHFTRIAVGDCRDGILFYSYHEDSRKLEQVYCDPVQRLVADCVLMDVDTAFVSDRKGSVVVLSCADHLEDNASPERNLTLSCSYFMGEIAMSMRKGSFSYKLPADDMMKNYGTASNSNNSSRNCIMASTLLGSIVIFIPITREEYELLEDVQARLVVDPLTSPILGNDHNEFRSRGSRAGIPKVLDGDILAQFLELTTMQQEAVLTSPQHSNEAVSGLKPSMPVMVNQVVRLLERVHYALS
ncbi:pre-mRNA-splicing factor prp12-like isoform X2 [Andrographis paniculata]|uniref:pre-mRNA-splicing factor prp12-like isoform X2 n=1 Tax=Andrographis paniculata TaxID=175694 RepID=UPI0021E75821|nr:pre-mRNA-splicing factor prp12-like isoform X2 [Andrographis paniculata]